MDKENDIFSKIIKEKLSNYSVPVDNDSWDTIEECLNSTSQRKTKRLWIAAFSVAASIALLFLLFTFNETVYHHEEANQLSGHEETIIQDVPEKTIVQSDLQQNFEHPTVFRKSQSGKQLAENGLTAEVDAKEEIPEEIQIVPATEEPGVQENPPVYNVPDLDSEKEIKIPAIRNKRRQSLSFSFSSGRNLSAGNNTALQGPSRSPIENSFGSEVTSIYYYKVATQNVAQPTIEEILLNENYPEVIHYPPLSFGLTVKKDLNRTFAIESGVVYSYIATAFSRESSYKSKADLQLHYIGIPLNIHSRLYGDHNSQWVFYLSTGGMVEKGILTSLVKKTFFEDIDNTVVTASLNEKIKGLQWSVSISPGVDYKIYKNYSVYLEPKLSYYFDNNQPESARTEHPVTIGVNAGLRYTW